MASQWPPKKNTAFTLYFTLYKNDGTVVANPGTYTKKVSIDGGAVAAIAAAVTEEDTTYGQLSLVIAAGEMNGDAIWIYITDDTAGTVPFTCTLYTTARTQDDIDTDVAAILVDTASIDTAGEIAAAVWSADATSYQTQGTFGQAIGDPAADANTIYGAVVTGAAGATVAADIVAVKAETALIVEDTGTTLPGTLATIAGYIDTEVASILAAVDTEIATIVGYGAPPAAAAIADAVWDEASTGHTDAGKAGQQLWTDIDAVLEDTADMQPKIGTPAGASISADIAAIEAQTDDIGAAGAGLTAIPWNAAWDAEVESEATDALNAYDPPTRAELTTDTNSVLSKVLKYVQLILRKDAAIGADNATEVTAINADGGSGAGAFANTTDAQEAIRDNMGTAQTGDSFARLGAPAGASVSADVAAVKAETASIQSDTNDIQTRIPAALVGGRMDASVGAVANGAITAAAIATDAIDADALSADALTEIFNKVVATAITEAYAADGAAPTLSQALMLIQQTLTEMAISGTTLTVNKLDGTTPAATFTLDDGTSPTSITRAT